MYMLTNTKAEEFDWDIYNKYKSVRKHGISNRRTESVFVDDKKILYKDRVYSNREDRFIIIGKDFTGKTLFVVFTIRNSKIGPISARPASRKERRIYEEKQKRS